MTKDTSTNRQFVLVLVEQIPLQCRVYINRLERTYRTWQTKIFLIETFHLNYFDNLEWTFNTKWKTTVKAKVNSARTSRLPRGLRSTRCL